MLAHRLWLKAKRNPTMVQRFACARSYCAVNIIPQLECWYTLCYVGQPYLNMVHLKIIVINVSCLKYCVDSAPNKHDAERMLIQCWPIVYDAGPTLNQHCFNVSCLLVNHPHVITFWNKQLFMYDPYHHRIIHVLFIKFCCSAGNLK